MKKPAILAGSMAVPIGRVDGGKVRKELTFLHSPMGSEEPTEVLAYRERGEYIHVPRQYGIALCRRLGIEYEDRTSNGHPVEFPRIPTPRDYQVDVLDEVEQAAQDYFDFIFRARTGFGKTIGSLIVAARFGRSTLVLVDQENLRDQWVEALEHHFGFTRDQIGVIQGKKCDFKGKAVTVGMLQTISMKALPEEAYDYFGTLIVDEVHTAGAPVYSGALSMFSATRRIGVSATPKRRDGLQKILEYNLGKVRVYVADQHDRSSLYIAEYRGVFSWYANVSPKTGRYITELTDDGERNLLLAEMAIMLYESGRDTLVLGDRIEQLQHLKNLCYYMGVPESDMGVYTGKTYQLGYQKHPRPPRRPADLVRHEGHGKSGDPDYVARGVYYTPVALQTFSKKVPKSVLESVKNSATLMFATYQMFAKGMDVPRLSGGVDASPRSQAEQVHGRILRVKEGKPHPIWVTIADTHSYRSLHQLAGRLPDYRTNNAALYVLNEDGTTSPCQANEAISLLREQVKELKSTPIETNSVGLNILRCPELPTLRELIAEVDTSLPDPHPRRPPPSRTASTASVPSAKLLSRTRSTRSR